MITDHASNLLREILADPANDDSRLVYADWLEEHGGEPGARQAEFIRLQMALARSGHTRGSEDDATWASVCRLREVAMDWVPESERIADALRFRARPLDGGAIAIEYEDQDNPEVIFRRGFVEAVTLPLAAFLGGLCPVCHGRGEFEGDPGYPAEACHGPCGGTGRIAALAGLFQQYPITAVTLTLTDRRPSRGRFAHEAPADVRGRGYWIWHLERPNTVAADQLPYSLYQHLFFGPLKGLSMSPHACQYSTEAAAMEALSRACVAYGRQLAGLPELVVAHG